MAEAADISIKKLTLKDGSIIIGSANSQKRSTYDHVNVAASDVSITSKFPVTVTADLPAGGKFKLDGTVGPLDQEDTSLPPLDPRGRRCPPASPCPLPDNLPPPPPPISNLN